VKKILIFSGTTEGRRLGEYLADRGFSVTMCVATEYGEKVVPKKENLCVLFGRMEKVEMAELIKKNGFQTVVDATHPYAALVTENIRSACLQTKAEYLRLLRMTDTAGDGITEVNSVEEAVAYLNRTEGSVLLTTGSKELYKFTDVQNYQERLFARVLSTADVALKCKELGFEGKNLIAMQGPFSEELNYALLRQIHAKWLVTKDTGTTGGLPEKLHAATRAGAHVILIRRPVQETGYSYSTLVQHLTGRPVERRISLVGIGMGGKGTLTGEAVTAFEEAACIIGAGRMLEAVSYFGKPTVNAYKTEEILDAIAHSEEENIAIALSGDIGFYSGAKKLAQRLKELDGVQVEMVPGVSSVAYLCARLGTTWEDVVLVSMHGRDNNLLAKVRANPKVFAIVGGGKAINGVLESLTSHNLGDVHVSVGCDLSYDTEKIVVGTANALCAQSFTGLCSVLIENPSAAGHVITHGVPDNVFIRGDVPMTKEEVRSVSLSKLRLCRDAVIYDVGAGTGSVSIEMALQVEDGKVFAIERKDTACALIAQNCKKFAVTNLEIIQGFAPEALADLPTPTHAFIGGSGGNMKQIVQAIFKKNPVARIVINTIAAESFAEAVEIVNTLPVCEVDIVQLSVSKSKKVSRYHMMMGGNPVFIISFTGMQEEQV
jgi:precorrin-6Y C5,15-methyltransferase (decarboxylating)